MPNKMLEGFLSRLSAHVAPRIIDHLNGVLPQQIRSAIDEALSAKMKSQLYIPNKIVAGARTGNYMRCSNPIARDFLHPEFSSFCEMFKHPIRIHRKLWEWAFIYHRLKDVGVLRAGMRGLGFGVGKEGLPSLFASMGVNITATDAPTDIEGWRERGEYAGASEGIFFPDLISREEFDHLVSYEGCDMKNIPDHLIGYDFCWSSCAFEHLGNLQSGIEFVINSVEKTLKIDGVACHTTEFNMSSDLDTVEAGRDVIYRQKDLEHLMKMLEARGHWVEPLKIEPGDLPIDYLVDVPPYLEEPHLKLLVGGYVTTSVGIVVRRGR